MAVYKLFVRYFSVEGEVPDLAETMLVLAENGKYYATNRPDGAQEEVKISPFWKEVQSISTSEGVTFGAKAAPSCRPSAILKAQEEVGQRMQELRQAAFLGDDEEYSSIKVPIIKAIRAYSGCDLAEARNAAMGEFGRRNLPWTL